MTSWRKKTEDDSLGYYYSSVAGYYDNDSIDFERRYGKNHVLQRIRENFRSISEKYRFTSALEIGCGPGLDLVYFAEKYPQSELVGIDVSPRMVNLAKKNIKKAKVSNATAITGVPEKLTSLFPNYKFDFVFCYFGALNTVKDFSLAVNNISKIVSDKGTLVLTFVNRWYMVDIFWNLLCLRFKRAVARVNNTWTGYSPVKQLESTCRSEKEINFYFSRKFEIITRKGYSIVYPSWFRATFFPAGGWMMDLLWKIDQLINKTPFWNIGEYSLYVLKPRAPR